MAARFMPPERISQTVDWQHMFDSSVLKAASTKPALQNATVRSLWGSYSVCFLSTRPITEVTVRRVPRELNDTWDHCSISCSCGKKYCEHAAAALMAIDKEHGPWILLEGEYAYERRVKEAQFAFEKQLRREEDQALGLQIVPALQAFPDLSKDTGPVLIDIQGLLSSLVTTPAAIAHMKDARKILSSRNSAIRLLHYRDDSYSLEFDCTFYDTFDCAHVWGQVYTPQNYTYCHVMKEKSRYDLYFSLENEKSTWSPDEPLSAYGLAVFAELLDRLKKESAKDITSDSTRQFFAQIIKTRQEAAHKEIRSLEPAPKKDENVVLIPRLSVDEGNVTLSFKIGSADARKYILKSSTELFHAVDQEKQLVLGKKDTLDFARQSFVPSLLPLYDFLKRNNRESYGGIYQMSLNGSHLDSFYDLARGMQGEMSDKYNNIKDSPLVIDHADIHFTLTVDRLTDARGTLLGVSVTGFVPVLLKGKSNHYVLDKNVLSRITPEEEETLSPFIRVADAARFVHLRIGMDHLQAFYYHVLPGLLSNPYVEIVDNAADDIAAYLPPEAVFQFYLDLEDQLLTLRGKVTYGESTYPLLPDRKKTAAYRDWDQEMLVVKTIHEWLPQFLPEKKEFQATVTDDSLYDFLTAGLPTLEYYGAVHGSAAFRQRRVLPEPRVQLGVSVDHEGLLNLSVTSRDISHDELLALYESYTRKKRYYRMRSGDFIDLTQDDQFQDLDTFFSQVNLLPLDVLRGKTQLPMYRALYLNRMLEAHDQIVSTRDRTYRALIRNFHTVRDAEFELPASMEEVLRPYQTYGFKWLRTLEEAGFGGILADEMGLGKTLQMIALFLSDKERSEKDADVQKLPSLVVCPASLVYNWQEEIQRFAPSLRAVPLAGHVSSRRAILKCPGDADVLITSYDLLKRDIALYEDLHFQNCVLDEAQYIKNAKAAVAKSVKLIHAAHRFALTGTPIENRLSELWSIFDFLMPGFLYSQSQFQRDFELPIARDHNEEKTDRLKGMTAPFILRRKKADVLKDLPAKLEEVRYARLSGEQQRIYDAQVVHMKHMLASSGKASGEEKIRIFSELTRIRQICCDPSLILEDYTGESAKREACMELIQSAMEGGHRMLVFSQFVSMLDLLEKDLQRAGIAYYKIVGATPKEKRLQLVRSFNEGTTPVFLISLKAGGTGLNLTGADVVIHYDPWWNLAAQNQATDRAHRIGQTHEVTVFKLILKDTIEERIMQLQDAKKDLAEAILEGSSESILSLSPEELMQLLG